MVTEAAHVQLGNTDADLKRLKYAVTNLKGGVQELDGHARFLQGTTAAANGHLVPGVTPCVAHSSGAVLDTRALQACWTHRRWRTCRARSRTSRCAEHSLPVCTAQTLCCCGPDAHRCAPTQWSEQVKAQKAELDTLRGEAEHRIAALCAEVAAFEEERARAAGHLAGLHPAVAHARRAGFAAVPLTPPDEGPEHVVRRLRTVVRAWHFKCDSGMQRENLAADSACHQEETRAAIAATEQALVAEEAAAAAVLADADAAEASLRQLEAQLASIRAAAAAAEQQVAAGAQHTSLVEYAGGNGAAQQQQPSGGVLANSAAGAAQAAHALSELVVLLRCVHLWLYHGRITMATDACIVPQISAVGGLELLSARPDALTLRCTSAAGVAHALALRLEANTAKVLSAALEPAVQGVSQQQLDELVAQAQGKAHVVVREVMAVLEGRQ